MGAKERKKRLGSKNKTNSPRATAMGQKAKQTVGFELLVLFSEVRGSSEILAPLEYRSLKHASHEVGTGARTLLQL